MKKKNAPVQHKPASIGPSSYKQEQVIWSDSTITLLSGAAGASKTYGILLAFLRYVEDPHTQGIIFRRNSKMITLPGSIWDEALGLYTQVDPKLRIRSRDNELIFSTGAKLKFNHMENDSNMHDHQGGQYSFVAFDETTHWPSAIPVYYILSRMRSTKTKYKPRMIWATNPLYGHWLWDWVKEYCDLNTGIPKEELSNKEMYFVRQGDTIIREWDRQKLVDIYGDKPDTPIQSFRCISSTAEHNPILLQKDPGYIGRLKSLPDVEMKRLLLGSWLARELSAGYYKRQWTLLVPEPTYLKKKVRAWDLAGTIPSSAYPDPDWTVGVLMSRGLNQGNENTFCVEHVNRFRERFNAVEQEIIRTAYQDGRDTTIVLPQDPGASGAAYAKTLQMRLIDEGFTVRLKKPESDKLTRFKPFASVAESGFVRVCTGEWNEDYFKELENFEGKNTKGKDDQVDATSDAFWALKSQRLLPSFSLPNMARPGMFSGINDVENILTAQE